MSALPPKADMCSAGAHVCFGPKADISAKLCILNFVVAAAAVATPLQAALGYASNVEMVSDPDLGAASICRLVAFPAMTNDKRNVSICLRSCSSDRDDWACGPERRGRTTHFVNKHINGERGDCRIRASHRAFPLRSQPGGGYTGLHISLRHWCSSSSC